MGEYAVTVPGEPGIAVAAPARGTARFTPAEPPVLTVVFRFGGREQIRVWSPAEYGAAIRAADGPAGTSNALAVPHGNPISAVMGALRASGLEAPAGGIGGELVIDTGAFYAGERKLGLGSSAASILLLTAAARVLSGAVSPGTGFGAEERKQIAAIGVHAHRAFQGGRGSGYDVLVSAYGGWIRVIGGRRPEAIPLAKAGRREFPVWALFSGPAEVRTGSAIDAFDGFASTDPAGYRAFLAANRDLCDAFVGGDAAGKLAAVSEAAELGRRLGTGIGISADPGRRSESERGLSGGVWKALGAGNELIAWFGMPGTSPPAASLIQYAQAEPVTGLEVIWS